MGHAKHRKMAVFALSLIISRGHSTIFPRLNAIFTCLTTVLYEILDMDKETLKVYWYESNDELEDDQSMDTIRRKALKERDIVYTPNVATFIRQRFDEAEVRLPGFKSQLGQYVNAVVLKQMEELMSH